MLFPDFSFMYRYKLISSGHYTRTVSLLCFPSVFVNICACVYKVFKCIRTSFTCAKLTSFLQARTVCTFWNAGCANLLLMGFSTTSSVFFMLIFTVKSYVTKTLAHIALFHRIFFYDSFLFYNSRADFLYCSYHSLFLKLA